MIQSVIHCADIHLRLFKRHEEYTEQFEKFYKECENHKPDRIVIVGDLVHSKNQMTPELIFMVTSFLNNCSKIAKTVINDYAPKFAKHFPKASSVDFVQYTHELTDLLDDMLVLYPEVRLTVTTITSMINKFIENERDKQSTK